MTDYKAAKKITRPLSNEFHDYKRVTNTSRKVSRARKVAMKRATRNAIKRLTRAWGS